MAVTSRQGLIDYCLRNLGWPVIEINVDDDQVSDRIDEALEYYQEFHTDAVLPAYTRYQVTQTDIDNEYIPIASNVTVVKRLLPLNSDMTSSGNIFDVNYQIALSDVFGLRGGIANVAYFNQIQSHLALMRQMFEQTDQVKFSRHANRLSIYVEWGTDIQVGDWIVMETHTIIDPEVNTDVYNDTWLKRYATALIKRQWGTNLKKFEGMQLPGGLTFSGQVIYDEADAEIKLLEEEIRLVWEEPIDFFVG